VRYFIIVNPIAGRGLGGKSIPRIEEAMQGMDYKLVRTEHMWHAKELAEGATREGYDVIVSASGDGTLNEAINGILHARTKENNPAFSVLSIGTGNDFSGGVGIPTSLEEGLQALKANKRKKIDLGFVKGGDYPDGRYFGNGIGVGFDAAVGNEAVKVRWTRGLPAYLIGVIKTVFLFYNPPRLQITLDDETITQVSLMVSVMNGKRMGGGFKMAPESKSDDGVFDLCIAETASKARILGLIPHFLRGSQATQPEIKMRRSRRVDIIALDNTTFPAHADGEFICLSGSSLTVELLPLELEIIYA
jgi:diacylglycerol kinase (ATP)